MHNAGLHKSFSQQLGAVAVLSPYRAQLAALRRSFQRCGAPAAALADVTFATVDGFQVGLPAAHRFGRRPSTETATPVAVRACAHPHPCSIPYLSAISAHDTFVFEDSEGCLPPGGVFFLLMNTIELTTCSRLLLKFIQS